MKAALAPPWAEAAVESTGGCSDELRSVPVASRGSAAVEVQEQLRGGVRRVRPVGE